MDTAAPEKPVKQVVTIFAPVLYLAGLTGLFLLFTRLRRKPDAITPYFAPHVPKSEHDELAELFGLSNQRHRRILEIALMRRAIEDIKRAVRIQEEKPSVQNMVSQGIVGEGLLVRIRQAEAELNVEMVQVLLHF